MESSTFSIGIIFNAFVSGIVAAAAIALVFFLFKRYRKLHSTMRAYAWFWFFTALVWIPLSIRYLFIGFGSTGQWPHYFDILLQFAVFLGGLPLIYYIGLRVFNDQWLAGAMGLASILPIATALWLILQPGGLIAQEITFFSAETIINTGSLIIFNVEGGLLLALLIYDIIIHLNQWRKSHIRQTFYRALYSLAIVIYLALGILEQSGLVNDWTLVVFRILYAATFLFVYLLITQHEAADETYFQEEANIAAV
ncbi:hypothetical protein A3I40_02915 [Candidatus Uhrbacteria bacterium RIFCSPLOWO2_02_FULL_48_12]|uniref:Histidine kinase N-terminal 7TM region domain-containing protein n=1 Tax=Candidatus Uhrbacteria bacterium RIFCSPLOWO2_02_FULL_48_12 TaxID=1802407 RepID=A0A1F7V9N8_9BACT|nr:MAG: hypothetical protein A3I40_02915 [Candidatus Uhrbacteria bacterium RIFCSPLOWO2_02_FULL_48_12]